MGLKLDTAKLSRKITGEAEKRIRLDFGTTPAQRKILGADFDRSLRETLIDVVGVAIPAADLALKEGYIGMLTDVADQLQSGFPNPQHIAVRDSAFAGRAIQLRKAGKGGAFAPLNWAYWQRKARTRPGTEKLFWKYKSGLNKSFRGFVTKQAALAGFNKSRVRTGSGQYEGIKLVADGYKNHRRYYRFTLSASLPAITQSAFRDVLFRQQFMLPEIAQDYTQAKEPAETIRHMAYNEPRRSWVQERVRQHGYRTQVIVFRRIKDILS